MLINRKNFLILAMILLPVIISYAENTAILDKGYMDVFPAKAMELLNEYPDLMIVDVSNMWAEGHLPGALSFPLGNGSFAAGISSWDKEKKYLIYCHGDGPSIKAAQMLVKTGFQYVYRLEGNYGAWVADGYDVEIGTYQDISAMELKQMMEDNPDLIVIDVSPMYEKGHIPGAVNYYIGDGSLDNAIPKLDPQTHYAVYCHMDSASIAGAKKLVKVGFTNVYRLKGNYKAWIDAGYEIETGL